MIDITINELMNCAGALQELAKKPMKTKAAFQTARLIREIEKEYNLFQDARKNLIEKYGIKDENGNLKEDENGNYSVDKKNIKPFNEELNEILKDTITLNAERISINDLIDANFTPSDIILLESFLKEEN